MEQWQDRLALWIVFVQSLVVLGAMLVHLLVEPPASDRTWDPEPLFPELASVLNFRTDN